MTVHFVYSRGIRQSTPQTITRELGKILAKYYQTKVYDIAQTGIIEPAPGDILLGHPHRDQRTIFVRSFHQTGWSKRVVMCPFSHGLPEICAWVDPLICEADAFLAIAGKPWFDTMEETYFSHWRHKSVRLDLAVRPEHYPSVKRKWNVAGARRFLYIGYVGKAKGTDYLCALAEANPDLHFAWIGGGGAEGGVLGSSRVEALGACDMSLQASRELVASFDFVISCGRSDANPTTLLEALAWGLVPICTVQSGYDAQRGEDWVVNFPLDNLVGASAVLHRLNQAESGELDEYVRRGRRALASHYTWDRFGADVISALRAPSPARPTDRDWLERAAANTARLRAIAGGK
jgi:glycosyltransferase involved in cell wall biosynthesis